MDSLNLKWRRNVIRLRSFFFLVSGMFLERGSECWMTLRRKSNVITLSKVQCYHFVKSPILSLCRKRDLSVKSQFDPFVKSLTSTIKKVKNAIGSFWLSVMFLMLWFLTKWCHFWQSDHPLIFWSSLWFSTKWYSTKWYLTKWYLTKWYLNTWYLNTWYSTKWYLTK